MFIFLVHKYLNWSLNIVILKLKLLNQFSVYGSYSLIDVKLEVHAFNYEAEDISGLLKYKAGYLDTCRLIVYHVKKQKLNCYRAVNKGP